MAPKPALLALAAALLAPGLTPQVAAQTADSKGKEQAPVVTQHEVIIEGTRVKYTATAGYMTLPDYEGKPKANIFYIAYTRDADAPPAAPAPEAPPAGEAPGAPATETTPAPAAQSPAPIDPATRPITFAFNGGPGSSSVWLHMGALGPKRVCMESEGWAPPPPYATVDNEHSWLDVTDLVFIDPVSTGYSRPVEGESAGQFHGLQEDIRSVGDFIRLYTTRSKRWASPKYLAGESYGTTRAAGLAGYLQETHGMYLSGIVLVSAVLNFQTIRFDSGNDLPYVLYLPTYTATAWYHKKLDAGLQADLKKTIDEVRTWALGEYHLALAQGSALTDDQRKRIGARLARYTGLSEQFVENSNLRIEISNFCKELLRDRDLTVGRLDSRFTGIDADSVGSRPEYDPSMAAISGPYTACLNGYVRRELNYENDLPYEILTSRVNPWNYSTANNRYVNVAETLRQAMTRNRSLRVLVASGYYDLATPFFASDYTVSHLGLPADLAGNVRTAYFEGGHMMYIREVDLAGLKQHAAEFIAGGARK
jgi:carboxypeptidase C (cathepsin A)